MYTITNIYGMYGLAVESTHDARIPQFLPPLVLLEALFSASM